MRSRYIVLLMYSCWSIICLLLDLHLYVDVWQKTVSTMSLLLLLTIKVYDILESLREKNHTSMQKYMRMGNFCLIYIIDKNIHLEAIGGWDHTKRSTSMPLMLTMIVWHLSGCHNQRVHITTHERCFVKNDFL